MGGISSRPKTPQIKYVVKTVNTSDTTSASDTSDSDVAAEVREDDLLRRQRGRGGTVLTGFRGLSTAEDKTAGRKTLLGE